MGRLNLEPEWCFSAFYLFQTRLYSNIPPVQVSDSGEGYVQVMKTLMNHSVVYTLRLIPEPDATVCIETW